MIQLRIFIGKNFQGKGYSIKAIDLLKKKLKKLGFKILLSVCNKTNYRGNKMIVKAGFEKVQENSTFS